MLVCGALAVAGGLVAAAQQQQPQRPRPRPTFTSAVDVVSVDVNAVDKDGHPVADLDAADFTLTVDGHPRKLASAQFISQTTPVADAASPQPALPSQEYTANVGAQVGRLIVLVADRGSVTPIRAKDVFAATARFVESLAPADRVALFSIPEGPNLPFTTDHHAIVTALLHMDGAAHSSSSVKYVGVAESMEIERGNGIALDTVMRRECGAPIGNAQGSSGQGEQAICLRLVQDEAAIVAQYTHERARNTINALTGILQRLGSSETPKTLVLISEGLVVEGERFVTNGLSTLLAASHTTVYAMKPEPSDSDASQPRAPQNVSQDRTVKETGLSIVTRLGGGELFRIIGNPDFSFGRLRSELSGYYLLGFEPETTDRDGKQHKITVAVRRPDVQVRSRAEFTVDPPGRGNAEQAIVGLLRSPAFATAVPVKLTTYAFQDTDSVKIRLLVALEVERSDVSGEMALGIAMIKPDGETGATFYNPSIEAPKDGSPTQTCFATLVVEPGAYTLKAAVVDSKGRRGSVERPVRAYMTRIGRFRATQLMIGGGETQAPTPNTIVPTVTGTLNGSHLHAYMELFADAAGAFEDTSVTIEVVPEGGTNVVASTTASLQPTGPDPRVRAVAGSLRISLLPPGSYVARAIVAVGGRTAGDMTRTFTIVKP